MNHPGLKKKGGKKKKKRAGKGKENNDKITRLQCKQKNLKKFYSCS